MTEGDEDPWGFAAKRPRAEPAESASGPAARPGAGESSEAGDGFDALAALGRQAARGGSAGRERGVLRAEMGGPSLRRRAWPMALALALLAFTGYLTEVVASSQMLALAGPQVLLVIFPLGGLGLIVLALFQFRYVDHRARLPMIRAVGIGYAVAFAVVVGMLSQDWLPVVAIGLAWLLADQLTFLMPLLVWSLASDEFNVAESRRIYPWIVTWTYAGQIIGLGVSAVSPWLLGGLDVPLTVLLVAAPVICLVIALGLPKALTGSHAAQGTARPENVREAIAGARDFIEGVPVWRHFLLASLLTFSAGVTLYLVFLASAEGIFEADAAALQTLLGWAGLAWFGVCWAIQAWGAERLQNRIGIPGVLLILPLSIVVGGLILVAGSLTGSLAVLLVGVSFWLVPRWSVDENARRSALALVPDERRARVSFVVDLLPVAIGLIVSGPLALIGVLTGQYWLIAVLCVVIAALAVWPSLRVRREWDDSLLNWRLRRRKHNRGLTLD